MRLAMHMVRKLAKMILVCLFKLCFIYFSSKLFSTSSFLNVLFPLISFYATVLLTL
jgi:hypothetical protein